MMDPREEYKANVLLACRFAVEGGVLSSNYEDFLIDNIDELVASMNDDEFLQFLRTGKVPVNDLETDEEYNQVFERQQQAEELLSKELTPFEREKIDAYCSTLEELRNDYKLREWDL